MKKMLFPTLSSVLICIGLPLVAADGAAKTNRDVDFATTESVLSRLQEDIASLQLQYGRYDHQLVEPMRQLAGELLAADRFADAANTVEQAVQVVRIANGLYTPQQYDLRELGLKIARLRQDWKGFNAQLTHYRWLLGTHYRGTASDRLERMLRLADVHLMGAFDDHREQLSSHLMNATYINEIALAYAQETGQTESPLFLEALYGLTEKYFLEARTILGDGEAGYSLRHYGPAGALIDDRSDAVKRRYRAGLEKLQALRDAVAHSGRYGPEAAGMVEVHIADWHALFDSGTELSSLYARSMATLREAGIAETRLARFFANPVILPRPRLTLSINAALAQDSLAPPAGPARDPASDRLMHRVQVLEPSSRIPGFSRDLASLDWRGSHREDWTRLSLSLKLQPQVRESIWLGAYLTHSHASGSDIQLLGAPPEKVEELDSVLDRVRSLTFRPAFSDGRAVVSEIALDYVFDNHPGSSLTPGVVARTTANATFSDYREPGPNASLAVTGE